LSLYQRGNVWWSRLERNGEVFQRSTKCERKKDAFDIENTWKAEMARGEAGLYSAPTITGFSKRFLDYQQTRVSARSFIFYATAWQHIVNSNLAGVKLNLINSERIESFVAFRTAQTYTRGEKGTDRLPGVTTVNHDLRCLRRALHLAEEWSLIRRAPKIELLRGEKQRELTIDETTLSRFLSLADSTEMVEKPFPHRLYHPEMKAVLPFLIDTGLRIGEMCQLDWTDVNFENGGSVFVRKGKTRNARRTVPLTARARAILRSLEPGIAATSAVFHRLGQRITTTWATHQFLVMRRALGLPDALVLHSCRHTFCSRLGKAGVSPYVLQKLAGHANITISARYTHSDSSQLEAAIGALES
jgi:integrase